MGSPGSNLGRGDFYVTYASNLANCIYPYPSQTTTPIDPGDELGASLVWLGDLNGDGRLELAVGSPGDDDGGTDRGAVRIFSGDSCSGFSPLTEIAKIGSSSGGFGPGLSDGDGFGGGGLAAPGDLDGDGRVDLVVASPGDDDGGTDRGALWVLLLNADGSVKSKRKLSATAGGFPGALADGDGFGHVTAHDLDGNGTRELIVGAPFDDDGGTNRGALWILWDVPTATASPRNGSGVNPMAYTTSSPAALGAPWSAEVAHGPAALFTLIYGYLGASTGPVIAAGELLVDVTTPRLFRSLRPAGGTSDTHQAEVPSDISLVGLPIATQALVLDPNTGPTLTNAIDLALGG